MIKSEFGQMNFQELSGVEVIRKFNALFGSNTRPKASFDFVGNVSQKNLEVENVYF